MRLSLFEIATIVKYKDQIFGKGSKVFLFGSRVDDTLKGGDIDLYIEADEKYDLLEKKIEFLSLVEQALGEQKIDVIFKKDEDRPIEVEARSKGIELNIEKIRLDKYFHECDKHIQRIEEAYADMKDLFPLNAKKYLELTKDEVQDIDQYLFRFSKLQDTMGEKVFRSIIESYEQESSPRPFLDILNRLEKYGFINSAKEWMNLRRLRNEISHQYDDEPEEMSQAINALVYQKDMIIGIYFKIKSKYVSINNDQK